MRGASPHKRTKPCSSAHTVNGSVVRRKFMSLSGEISGACACGSRSADCGNAVGEAREVSRRHSSPRPEVMLRTW